MNYTIRTCIPQLHHPRLAAMLEATAAPPCTSEEFANWHNEFPVDGDMHEWVMTDESERAIGYANATREDPDRAPGEFEILVVTDPALRRQGIGQALLHLAEQTAVALGARHITANINADSAEAVAFSTRNGYQVERHTVDSRLNLAAFDEGALFPGAVDRLQQAGFRLLTLADAPGEASLQSLYQLNARVAPGFPGFNPEVGFAAYETWRPRLMNVYQGNLDLVVIAAEGDRYVGMTRMLAEDDDVIYSPHTSVDPDYRKRGIALGLKLFAARVARRRGAKYLTTNNDSFNTPILKINRNMGFVPTMSTYYVGKVVGEQA